MCTGEIATVFCSGERKQHRLEMNQNVFEQSHREAKKLIKLGINNSSKGSFARQTNFTKLPHKTRG